MADSRGSVWGEGGRSRRVAVHATALLQGESGVIDGELFNLSQTGAFVACAEPLPVGSAATLSIRSYSAASPLNLRCRVARHGDAPVRGMGVIFTDFDTRAKEWVDQKTR